MRNNSKGFTPILMILVLVVIAVIGYFAYIAHKSTVQLVTQPTASSTSPPTTSKPIAQQLVCKVIYSNGTWDSNLFEGIADAATLKEVSNTGYPGNVGYYTDKNHVYNRFYSDGQIKNSDPASFQLLNDFYAKDKNNVYYNSKTMGGRAFCIFDPIVDVATFKVLNGATAKDKNHVYITNFSGDVEIIIGADPGTFKIIDGLGIFGQDKTQVFYFMNPIKDADVNSFQVINRTYAKDKKNAYACGIDEVARDRCFIINNADVNSFKAISGPGNLSNFANGYGAEDKNTLYSRGVAIQNSDPKSFQILDDGHAKDKNNNYLIPCSMSGCRILTEGVNDKIPY